MTEPSTENEKRLTDAPHHALLVREFWDPR